MAKATSQDTQDERGAERALIDLVCLLARQAAREAFAEEQQVSTSPASSLTNMESDDV